MTTLAEYMILSGADNRPPMLDKDLYDSWKSRMELYMQNREHRRMISESVEHGSLIWPTIEENGVTRTKKYSCQGSMGISSTSYARYLVDKAGKENKLLLVEDKDNVIFKEEVVESWQILGYCKRNINDVYESIMARMDERLDQFVDQFANRMNDMMNPRRCREWEGDGVADDNYEEALVFDDDQYEEEIVSEFVGKGFVDKYPNFQEDENNASFLGVMLGVEEESMPVNDTVIEDVIEEEEGFVGKRGLDGEEDNIEDVVVMANELWL
ncbi:hypothetical protein Tco_0502598 [Tanacetum coccineum]